MSDIMEDNDTKQIYINIFINKNVSVINKKAISNERNIKKSIGKRKLSMYLEASKD